MKFFWCSALVVVALMAGSALLAACGGGDGGGGDGDELSLDEYFQQLEDVKETYDARGEAIDQEAETLGDDVGAFKDYFGDLQDVFGDALNDVRDLDPPGEVQDAHDDFVAALTAAQAEMDDIGDQIADVESLSELMATFAEMDTPESEASGENIEEACRDLQEIADENDIDIDLDCQDES